MGSDPLRKNSITNPLFSRMASQRILKKLAYNVILVFCLQWKSVQAFLLAFPIIFYSFWLVWFQCIFWWTNCINCSVLKIYILAPSDPVYFLELLTGLVAYVFSKHNMGMNKTFLYFPVKTNHMSQYLPSQNFSQYNPLWILNSSMVFWSLKADLRPRTWSIITSSL